MEPTPRHREYIEYYRARVKRYEGSARYPGSARSEQALLTALQEAADLESFQTSVQGGGLALDNAKALAPHCLNF